MCMKRMLRPNKKNHVYSRRFDGNATFLFIFTRIGETCFASFGTSNDTGLWHQWIRQCGFSVVDVSNDGHVTDVLLLVHHGTDFINSEVHLQKEKKKYKVEKKGAEMGSYEIIQASRSVYKSVSALQSTSLKSTCKILWNSKSHLFIDENEKKNGWFCIEILKFERYLIKFVIVAYSFHCIHIFLCCMFRTRFDHCVIDPSAIRCTSSNFSIQYLKLNFPNENYRFHRK